MNMHLYKENKKINAKGIILSLGLKSANVYIPGYNIIKEVPWKSNVEYSQKEGIRVKQKNLNNPEDEKWIDLQRNDSIDIEIESQLHQEVGVTILANGSPL